MAGQWKISPAQYLAKTCEFDYHPDLTDLLTGTAITPGRDFWAKEFSFDAFIMDHGARPQCPKGGIIRVILKHFQSLDLSLEDFIRKIEEDIVPDTWKVIVLVAKERELKVESRFSARFCMEMRLNQVATEHAIASQIFRYIKLQSMTLNETAQTAIDIHDIPKGTPETR